MRVLVDTSVWIDHLHCSEPHLEALLRGGHVWTHTVVIGEMAAGRLRRRAEILAYLQKLPRGDEIDLTEGLHLLAQQDLAGRGLSWSDVQLLAAASIDHLRIWTRDRAQATAAGALSLAYTPIPR